MSRYAALDAGSLVAKIAISRADADSSIVTRTGDVRDALTAILAAVCGTDARFCLAVPDTWLDGGVDGGRHQEELRHLAEDEFGLTGIVWTGQLAAVAALAALESAVSGRCLVCDVGGSGVRVAACDISGRTIRTVAVHDAPGGGWRDFDAAVRATLGAGAGRGLDEWYLLAQAQDRRATLVLDRARRAPEFREAKAYSLAGYELTAGQVADCFAPTAERIRTGVAAVLDGSPPAVSVLAGGLAWFPLAVRAMEEAAATVPMILGPDAAVRGALLVADGHASVTAHRMPHVSLPMHQVRNGLLEEVGLPLPWAASFAPDDDEPVVLSGPELTLDIEDRRVSLSVPSLASGEYRVGVRPSWSGSAVLVLRGRRPGNDVHVIPLDIQETTIR